MIIISIITLVTCNELVIMKGVRRQRYTGCMMMMATFILMTNVASNVPAARDRMVGGSQAEARREWEAGNASKPSVTAATILLMLLLLLLYLIS